MYTAAVLQPESADVLKQAMRDAIDLENRGFECVTPQGEPLPHHMTMNLGPFDSTVNKSELLGKPAILWIDSLWWCETIGACAARVNRAYSEGELINSSHDNKHITICLKPPAKAFHSNKIFDGGKMIILKQPLTLMADIQEVK